MSKGDWKRPRRVTDETYNDNWNRAFLRAEEEVALGDTNKVLSILKQIEHHERVVYSIESEIHGLQMALEYRLEHLELLRDSLV